MSARPSVPSRAGLAASAIAAVLIGLIAPLPALADPPVFQLDNSGGTSSATGTRNGFVFGGELTNSNTTVANASSFMPVTGMLDAPAYFSPSDNRYYSLTYNPPHGIPLSFAIAHGTGGTSPAWTGNTQLIHTQDGNGRDGGEGFNVLSGDFNGANSSDFTVVAQTIVGGTPADDTHTRGPGTLTVQGTIAFTGGPVLQITHKYSALLGTSKNWMKGETTVKNLSATSAANVNFWIGTSDDHIGGTDSVAKVKGFVTGVEDGSGFSPRCDGNSNGVLTYVGSAGAGSYVLLYSQASGAESILSGDINDWNTTIVGLEPSASEFEVGTEDDDEDGVADGNDGSYGLYLPIGALAATGTAGDSKTVTWYYEGGSLQFIPPANCGDGQQAAAVSRLTIDCTPDPVAPRGLVTCEVTGGDPDIDILWEAELGGVFATAGVRLDSFGRGTFTFRAPANSSGRSIAVALVDWVVTDTVLVSGTPVPNRLPAGGGPAGPAPGALVAGLILMTGIGATRLRKRALTS